MENVKYILIISQYYYSHHCFVVSAAEDNFREKALLLIEKLEDYKRDEGDEREYHYGCERSDAYRNIRYRWNVNDSGDIYFIPCYSILDAMKKSEEYNSELHRLTKLKGAKAAEKKAIDKRVSEHHSFSRIEKIVRSVFEVL
ncbi:MAG: hypothetical protein ACI4XF_11335 [Oscillospiraceae bacterium]